MEIGSMSEGPPGPPGVFWSFKSVHAFWESGLPYIGSGGDSPTRGGVIQRWFSIEFQMDMLVFHALASNRDAGVLPAA
jgi:hypothetical protein